MSKHASDGPPAPPFSFSRICPPGESRQLDDAALGALAEAMTGGRGRPSGVPAGYTYLGQFVAHDLTSMKPNRRAPGAGPELLRSPTLDLDTLYGGGPGRGEPGRIYADDRHLRIGRTEAEEARPPIDGADLPRGRGEGGRQADIPDRRNDENVGVAQIHVAFIRFHNRVVDALTDVPAGDRFAAARRLVTLHYQWIVRCEYLPLVCSPKVLDDVFARGRKLVEPDASPEVMPTMPYEFAAAAFRFGHSQIRRNYGWNHAMPDGALGLDRLFGFSARGGDLGGRPRLPSSAAVDYPRLFAFKGVAEPNFAMRIDTSLTSPLRRLPDRVFKSRPPVADSPFRNLAFRDFKRAKRLKLATGQQMAECLAKHGVEVSDLSEHDILIGDPGARLNRLRREHQDAIVRDTPLMFYILREAELNDGKLAGVGAHIVAETFHRAIEGSTPSILPQPGWRPTLGRTAGAFTMVDLLEYGVGDRHELLSPVG